MRFFSGIIGAVAGIIVGWVSALFFATLKADNNILFEGFILTYAAPVGLLLGAILGLMIALRTLRYLREREATGTTQSKKISVVLSLITGLIIVVAGMLWVVSNRSKPPSDRELLANFERHEATFNQLIEMTKADRWLDRVDEDWTSPKNPDANGVSPDRIAMYRRLLREAHVPRGFHAIGFGAEVDFYYWTRGSAISSDTDKGYAYLTTPPPNLLGTLDHCQPGGENVVMTYRHIRGNWYLFYEYIPG
jgi:hypothetical protein